MSERSELRANVTDWTRPIVKPPITEFSIAKAAGGLNRPLIARAAAACRRAAGRCHTAAREALIDSAALAWREDAAELEAAASILEKLNAPE